MKSLGSELLLLVFLCLTASCVDDAQWKSEILQSVYDIAKIGSPGQSIVFGNNAAVIVLGDTASDILIAASELGNGRVVVMTHSGYLTNFNSTNSDPNVQTLQTNIKKWVSKGAFTSNSELITAESYVKYTGSNQYKILYTTENRNFFTQAQKDKVLNFVKNGGALVVSATPWGWAQLKGSNDFTLMLTYKTMLEAGIVYTEDIIWGSSTFKVINPNTPLSHVGVQLGYTLAPLNSAIDYSRTINVASRVRVLPDAGKQVLKQQQYNGISLANLQITAPSKATPITSVYDKARLTFYQYVVLQRNQDGVTAPSFNLFPGTLVYDNIDSIVTSQTFIFTANPLFQQFQHTGLYALAGQPINIQVIGTVPVKSWSVRVGVHSDDNSKQSDWIRWPTVFLKTTIKFSQFKIVSPYGGLIFFESPQSSETLQVKISGGIQAPFYNSQQPASINAWSTRRNAPGIWGCAQGKWVAFCIPSSSLKTVDDPSQILNKYDQIHQAYHSLRGTLPQNERKRFIVSDIRPSAGYMHSGYPIVTGLDVATSTNSNFIFNMTNFLKNGDWGIFHEMGHNMQRGWWTFDGTGEVTCNIFSLKATQIIVGTSPKNASWLNNQKTSIKNYLLRPNFDTWKSKPGIALGIYAQVIEDYGWNMMNNVMSWYQTAASSQLPSTNQDKIDIFWARYSLKAGVDLTLLLKKWGIPYTQKFTDLVVGLPPYVQIVKIF